MEDKRQADREGHLEGGAVVVCSYWNGSSRRGEVAALRASGPWWFLVVPILTLGTQD